MTDDADQLTPHSILREYRFESGVPVLGPFITRLRSTWYNVAARWADQSIISQQTAYNQVAAQQVIELRRTNEETRAA